jgi:sialate O-acetylesterase
MVFAAKLPIRIYGTGAGKAEITFAGQTKTVVSNDDKWLVEFSPMEYGGPYELIFDCGEEKVILNDIYIGEVYLFAGQSNMQFKMCESTTDKALYETNENLRLFSTDRIEKTDYYTACDGWVKCEKERVGDWSAITYLTGIEIAKSKNIAVGAITCYQGASVIESWVPEGTFKKNGIDIPLDKKHIDHTNEAFSQWNKDGTLYSYALSQVVPFSISAVVWYQGESDTSLEEAKVYKSELSVLIDTWRNDFLNDKLPFVIIQIADFDNRKDTAWKSVQTAQYEIQKSVPYTKTVISADVCESDDIHPPTKLKLSKRIALALEEEIFGV